MDLDRPVCFEADELGLRASTPKAQGQVSPLCHRYNRPPLPGGRVRQATGARWRPCRGRRALATPRHATRERGGGRRPRAHQRPGRLRRPRARQALPRQRPPALIPAPAPRRPAAAAAAAAPDANSFRGRGAEARFRFQAAPLPPTAAAAPRPPALSGSPPQPPAWLLLLPRPGLPRVDRAAPGGGARGPGNRNRRCRRRRRHRCGTVSVSAASQHGSGGRRQPRSSQAGVADASRQRGPHRLSLRPALGAGGSGREGAQLRQGQLPRLPQRRLPGTAGGGWWGKGGRPRGRRAANAPSGGGGGRRGRGGPRVPAAATVPRGRARRRGWGGEPARAAAPRASAGDGGPGGSRPAGGGRAAGLERGELPPPPARRGAGRCACLPPPNFLAGTGGRASGRDRARSLGVPFPRAAGPSP